MGSVTEDFSKAGRAETISTLPGRYVKIAKRYPSMGAYLQQTKSVCLIGRSEMNL